MYYQRQTDSHPNQTEMSADEAELSAKKLGQIICIVAGG